MFEDEMPKRKLQHEIGQDISLLSFEELMARIDLLENEITRLKNECNSKKKSRTAAEALFK